MAADCADLRPDSVRCGDHATDRTPRRGTYVSRQVSWLAGQCGNPAFPGRTPVALMDCRSPLTVAGAAPASSPASLLAPSRGSGAENLNGAHIAEERGHCQAHISIYLYHDYHHVRRGLPAPGRQARRRQVGMNVRCRRRTRSHPDVGSQRVRSSPVILGASPRRAVGSAPRDSTR